MKERQELMNELLDNTNIPALSFSWSQKGTRDAVAYGKTDTSIQSRVDTNTLFQAASLSKPVSAAIILDLVAQGKWDLDTPLADIADYGPPELRQDPHYRTLTTRMVIGQCSGLANFGQDGDDGKKFIATPNTRFTYSGVALDFLKEVLEKKTGKEWEEVAQDFFKKAGMQSSTFMRQLPGGYLNDTRRDVAKAHMANPHPDGPLAPLPPLPDEVPGGPAGSLLTTAEDYISFLQYCYKNEHLKSTLLTGVLSSLPPTTSPETSYVQWGLGMGVYNDKETGKTIAFHWGNNTGSISFCAMDMATGDCVASFANSMNGPSVFLQVAEPIVGNIKPLFQWLSTYCGYNDVNPPKKPENIATIVHAIHSLAKTEPVNDCRDITHQFREIVKQLQERKLASTSSSDLQISMNIS
ncbi:hypothetical protein FOLKNPGA_03379 [Legionella sp. PC1000]|uniref:serine hydrolase domain-containing protein n=1 Tax=Legionella sp. PC1000 TaxID=2746060 RepID=UPI0015F7E5E7|nr:serine hydrolase domain-containing protein [Legionella sp. PC1000]QLZ70565.1 hypothetical protein FOLKNPGA_03379 [Legionella sp. PC1000]